MRVYRLNKMSKGWLIGNFPKAAYKTRGFEVAVKAEKTNECVKRHLHKIATEITVVVEGRVRINNREFGRGDIIVIKPEEAADYKVLRDAITVIIKIPSARNDKYYTEDRI